MLGKNVLGNLALATISDEQKKTLASKMQNIERSMFVNQTNTIRYVKPNDSH